MQGFLDTANWPPLVSLYGVLLAQRGCMFVGLEREWRGKEAGLCTFGFAALLGALGGLRSSGSSIASATTLMTHRKLPLIVGVTGVILSSLTSILIKIPLFRSITKEPPFKRKAFLSLVLIAAAGLVGVAW